MKTFLSLTILLFAIAILTAQSINSDRSEVFSGETAIGDTLSALHYHIHLDILDFSGKTISGNTIVELESKVDNLAFVRLELLSLTVDEVKVNGVATAFTHSGYILHIPLAAPLNTGQTVEVDVHYHGQPFHENWGGFHWSGEYAFNLGVGFVSIPHNLGKTWFPCIDDFKDRAYYDFYITTHESKKAVCGGTLVGSVNNGNGTITWHWKINNTIPTYLASVAVGAYANVSDVYAGVNGNIPIEFYVRPMDSAKVPGSFQNLKQILAIFEDAFGPYPFERVGYVGTAIGAMEHATNIAYPHFCINNTGEYESLYAHEVAHMWFGDNVTCANAGEMWLNEGWAVFSEALYREFLYDRTQYDDFIRDKHADVLQFCHTTSGDGSYFPLNQIPETVTYGMSAYDKGATVAHSLRGYLGDEKFFDALKGYNDHFAFNYASSYDFRDFLTMQTGVDMSDFFDTWVLTEGTPHFSVDSFLVSSSTGAVNVEVFLRQKRKGSTFIGNSNIVGLTFMDQSWNTFSEKVTFSGEAASVTVTAPFAPSVVLCDLHALLCDATTDYSNVITSTGDYDYKETFFDLICTQISDSAFVRVEHNWVPPDPLLAPVQGLTISDYRYWKVDGLFPQGFAATGKFWYNKNGFLDDNLLTNPADSVVLLYRTGPGKNWQFIDFERVGIWSIGYFFVDLQPGEYVVGVCDNTFVGTNEHASAENRPVIIFPNPSTGKVNFVNRSGQDIVIRIYDLAGSNIRSLDLPAGGKQIQWEAGDHRPGTFFAHVLNKNNDTLSVEKILIISEQR